MSGKRIDEKALLGAVHDYVAEEINRTMAPAREAGIVAREAASALRTMDEARSARVARLMDEFSAETANVTGWLRMLVPPTTTTGAGEAA